MAEENETKPVAPTPEPVETVVEKVDDVSNRIDMNDPVRTGAELAEKPVN